MLAKSCMHIPPMSPNHSVDFGVISLIITCWVLLFMMRCRVQHHPQAGKHHMLALSKRKDLNQGNYSTVAGKQRGQKPDAHKSERFLIKGGRSYLQGQRKEGRSAHIPGEGPSLMSAGWSKGQPSSCWACPGTRARQLGSKASPSIPSAEGMGPSHLPAGRAVRSPAAGRSLGGSMVIGCWWELEAGKVSCALLPPSRPS